MAGDKGAAMVQAGASPVMAEHCEDMAMAAAMDAPASETPAPDMPADTTFCCCAIAGAAMLVSLHAEFPHVVPSARYAVALADEATSRTPVLEPPPPRELI